MKFWQSLSFTEPEQLVDLARICEELGFEGVVLSDHLFFPQRVDSAYPYSADGAPAFGPDTPFPDPMVTAAVLAAATERLRFALLVYILPLRHPFEVAKAAATVALLSGNRFALGAGAGWMKEEFDALGVDFHSRGKRFNETIEVLRLLWRGGMQEYHGRFFDFAPMQMSPPPSTPVPIYIGGKSKAALRRAANLGDGWVGAGESAEEAAAILGELRALRADGPRRDQPFEAIVPLTCAPDAALLRDLETRGMTGLVNFPLLYTLGPGTTLEDKRAALEQYAEKVIRGGKS